MPAKKFPCCPECIFYKQAPEICRECEDADQFQPVEDSDEDDYEDVGRITITLVREE